jgi:hypothetical protein
VQCERREEGGEEGEGGESDRVHDGQQMALHCAGIKAFDTHRKKNGL